MGDVDVTVARFNIADEPKIYYLIHIEPEWMYV